MNFKTLKEKHRALRDNFPEGLSVRIHRSLSWLERAEKEKEDFDAQFIFLWISFNAAYAQEIDASFSTTEKIIYSEFVERLIEADSDKQIYKLLWQQYAGPVRTLIDNRFVYQPYWDSLKEPNDLWKESFEKAKFAANASLAGQEVGKLLQIVLSRLYVLRNQLIHGLATWNGTINREQVKDGALIMQRLVPVVINLMLTDPRPIWGDASYPVVRND